MTDNADGITLFAPGRLCLFGEHSDWAARFGLHKGFCIVVGTDQGISAIARPAEDLTFETPIPDSLGRPTGKTHQTQWSADSDTLLAAAKDPDEFFRYCAGVAHQMITRFESVGGLDLRVTSMDLPLRKGVSSSAAVCVLVARAFNEVYGLGLFPHELMELAYLGETLTGSQCGRMDQACIYGETPVLLTFEKDNDIRVEPIFPADEVSMFFVDLGGRKDTVRILSDLQDAYESSPDLQSALGLDNERIMRAAYHATCDGDAEALGELMTEAQSVFDAQVAPHSPDELASPLLHELLAMDAIQSHIYGGKGVGSQGDGTAQFVARSERDRLQAIGRIESAYPQMKCFELTLQRHVRNSVSE